MPFYEDIPRIIDRGRDNPKLGERKWRRWPSSAPGVIGRRKDNPRVPAVHVWALIDPESTPESIIVQLHNDSSRPAKFVVSNVLPKATIELDGNRSYTFRGILDASQEDPEDGQSIVVFDGEGRVLASMKIQ